MNGQYGAFTTMVVNGGSLIAATAALGQGWRRRAKWEPCEEDISKGPQKVSGLLSAVFVATLWVLLKGPEQRDFAIHTAIGTALLTLVSLLAYTWLVVVHTYFRVVVISKKESREKVIGGLTLTPEAREVKMKKKLTVQDVFRGAAFDKDRVWTRESVALAKILFILAYFGLTTGGTVALATVSILVGL